MCVQYFCTFANCQGILYHKHRSHCSTDLHVYKNFIFKGKIVISSSTKILYTLVTQYTLYRPICELTVKPQAPNTPLPQWQCSWPPNLNTKYQYCQLYQGLKVKCSHTCGCVINYKASHVSHYDHVCINQVLPMHKLAYWANTHKLRADTHKFLLFILFFSPNFFWKKTIKDAPDCTVRLLKPR